MATQVIMRRNRFREVQTAFPKFIDDTLREGAGEIKSRADTRLLTPAPSKVTKQGKGYLVEFGNKRYHYISYIEFGTLYLRPKPFLRPAVESVFPRIKRTLGNMERVL